jgi:hypothetical protein
MGNFRQNLLLVLVILSAIMIFLTYSPADYTNFWIYWVSHWSAHISSFSSYFSFVSLQCTVFIVLGFGYMMDIMFSQDLQFVYDPNPENWRRKTDPQT